MQPRSPSRRRTLICRQFALLRILTAASQGSGPLGGTQTSALLRKLPWATHDSGSQRRGRGIGRMRAIERAGVVVHHRVPDGDIVVPSPNPYVRHIQWVERHARLLAPLLDNLLQRVQGA